MEPTEPKEHPADSVEAKIVEAIKTCYDPEIPVDIYELGLIYAVDVEEAEPGTKTARVTMTLTSPACPVAGTLPPAIQQKVKDQVADAADATVEVVWDPPWSTDMMSDAAKLQLGMM